MHEIHELWDIDPSHQQYPTKSVCDNTPDFTLRSQRGQQGHSWRLSPFIYYGRIIFWYRGNFLSYHLIRSTSRRIPSISTTRLTDIFKSRTIQRAFPSSGKYFPRTIGA